MTRMFIASLAVIGLLGAGVAFAAKTSLEGIKCPLSGAPAKEEKAVSYLEGKVYFCCDNCPKAFEKDKDKYAAKANYQLVATKQYEQKACPVSGAALTDGKEIEVAGAKVGFCCDKCKGAAEKKAGDEQFEFLFGKKAFEKGKFAKVAAK